MKTVTPQEAKTVIELLQSETLLKKINLAGFTIDWKKLFDFIAEGVVIKLAPETTSEKIKPTIHNVDIFSTTIREDIDALKADTTRFEIAPSRFERLLGIVDRLEKRPIVQFSPFFTPVETGKLQPYVPPVIPSVPWPPQLPYVGDPPGWMGGATITGPVLNAGKAVNQTETAAVPDATGSSTLDDCPF